TSPPTRRHTDPFSAFAEDDDEDEDGEIKHVSTSHGPRPTRTPPPTHHSSPLAFPHHLSLDSPTSRVSLADDESGMMSPLTAAHAAATLTELAFLQSLLDPQLTRHDMHLLIGTRVQRLIRDDDAGRMGKMTPVALAGRRVPAIVLTVVLEMGVGAVVGLFSDLLERHVVLTSTLRALATGHATHSSWKSCWAAIGSMLLVGLSLMVSVWVGDIRTGIVCGLSIMLSASAAGIMGSLAPVFFKVIGFDPALCAGPLETAVQDLVGISIYLSIGRMLLP
ncbi:hypothetical protein BCR44DRAFT_1424145, partial [Catenaria anguillulae PL171]